MSRVAIAMSGGVDSSVAAALCVQKYSKENIFGVTMKLFCYGDSDKRSAISDKSCCSLDAINDAKAVCQKLGIAHYVIDAEREFEKAVIQNFISEYKKGRTPIPCIPCNTIIKFDFLLKKVQSLGADMLATGHYAQIRSICHSALDAESIDSRLRGNDKIGSGMTYRLLKGIDKTKDQSYFLYGMNQNQLAHTLFPLGGMKKADVRKLAARMKLKTAQKKESQGICFVQGPQNDAEGKRGLTRNNKYRVTDWMHDKVKIKPGKIIINNRGRTSIVGKHEGVIYYTVGQRKRIPGGYSEPMYVIRIDAKKNQVVIGTKKDLYSKELICEKVHWIAGASPKLPFKCKAKIRYNMEDTECIVRDSKRGRTLKKPQGPTSTGVKVVFSKPQRAITPGQSIVFFKGQEVLGGGIIRDQGV